ncbi:ankyrin repeat protein [Colletotrichum asianum]|uniref:Ankyrin repeat protein n=1 Tax=Colletotrichum asianum TaxID=702518 RepID=A0A8H3VTE4_9PEZI|nr:ankyrin repeat protein [Colletotrichum asianum]
MADTTSSAVATSNIEERPIVDSSRNSPEHDGIWASAVKALGDDEVKRLLSVVDGNCNYGEILRVLLEATDSKKAECMRKRWKVNIKGRTIILRDVFEKISIWVNKVIRIGDIAVQYNPASASLPWAVFRLIMQASVNDVEVFGYVMQSVESIAHSIAVCSVLELQYYASQEKTRRTSDQMHSAIKSLYVSILEYLVKVLDYFQERSMVRLLKSTIFSKGDMETHFANIELSSKHVFELAHLVESERAESAFLAIEGLTMETKLIGNFQQKYLENAERILLELREPIQRIPTSLGAIQDGLDKNNRGKILRAISNVPFQQHHKTAKRGRLDGTGRWLLEKGEFQEWRHCSSSSVLWLHGIPGCGKTKLASLVVDKLEENDTVAFFYCMRNPAEPERGQCEKILASLVRQIAINGSNSGILPPVVAKYEDALSSFMDFEDQVWTSEECKEVLLKLMDEYPSVTLILDALDEVNQEDREELLDILSGLLQESPNLLKIFVSSRDNYDISLHLAGCPNIYVDAHDNAPDIEAYIENELDSARLLHGRLSQDLRKEISKRLSEGAHGMFRWVALQIQSFRSLKLAADVRGRLGALPGTLEEAYWEIFEHIQASGEHAAKLATFTFQWLLCARWAVEWDSFAAIASSHLADGYTFEASEVLDVCSNLVVQRPEARTIELAHLSVREFLESVNSRGLHMYLPLESNQSIATACMGHIQKLSISWTQELTNLEVQPQSYNDSYTVEKLSQQMTESKSHYYIILEWFHHVEASRGLRILDPMKTLVLEFIFDCNKSGNTSHVFQGWCKAMRDTRISSYTIDERAIQPKGQPVWFAIALGWPEIVKEYFEYRSLFSEQEAPDLLSNLARGSLVKEDAQHKVPRSDLSLMTEQLEYAINNNEKDIAEHIASYLGVEAEAEAIVYAAKSGHVKMLRVLADHSKVALLAAGNRAIEAAAQEYLACRGGDWVDTAGAIAFLLENKVTVKSGETLLRRAVLYEQTDLVRTLLNYDVGSAARCAALATAVSNGDLQTAQLLLDHGAEPSDKSAVIRALNQNTPVAAANLIKAGFGIDGRFLDKARTPLHFAAEKGFTEVVQNLVERRAPLNVRDVDQKTPLHLAAERGYSNCVSLLLQHGADVLLEDRSGKIPLDLAEERHHIRAAESILNKMRRLMEDLKKKQRLRNT